MRLGEIMSKKVVTVDLQASARSAWTKMQDLGIRHLVVTENKKLAGVISERDLGGKNGAELLRGRKVQDLMSSKLATATPKTSLREAANLMRGRMVGSLPVLENDRVVGIVTATDVLDALGKGASKPEGLYRKAPVGRRGKRSR